MFALPKWLTDIKKLFGSADGKYLGRVDGEWEFSTPTVPPSIPDGGTTGQLLAKASNDDYDTVWTDKPEAGEDGTPCPDYVLQNMGVI